MKFDLYEENSVGEYWIVFPGEKSVAAYGLENGRYQLRGTYFEPGLIPCQTLPELRMQWGQVFAGI